MHKMKLNKKKKKEIFKIPIFFQIFLFLQILKNQKTKNTTQKWEIYRSNINYIH